MNKKCFRVIFSKTLQRLVVTSELAKADGKSTEVSACPTLPFASIFPQIRPLVFSLFCALGFVAFSDSALAETLIIKTDKAAPKSQRPIILQTANGLPQINIQTPNAKGLSHNKYTQFNVDTKGAILNNSRTNAQTKQAGWVQGNPNLARGEAKVILNEVTSNNPSVLKGYVEVAGKKADVIIANPSGIHCQGCGIINTDRATFTTGKPQIKQGELDQFVVEKGKVTVSGKGLNNSQVDYTEILSREVQANAGIWSKKSTNIITGKNTVKRTAPNKAVQIIHRQQPLAGETSPQFAVDVGELGGMYSGKIHLIGTEKGVGVRNAGHIGASAETLTIDSQGRIVNTGTLNAHHAIKVNSTNGIENRGKIENHQGDITLTTQADIQQDGSVIARQGQIDKHAKKAITQQGESVAKGEITYTAPTIRTSQTSLIAAGVDSNVSGKNETRQLEKRSAQGKSIQLTATDNATLQGKQFASGKLSVSANRINLNHSQNSAYAISVQAKQGDIQANNARLDAQTRLQLHTPALLSTQSSQLNANLIEATQKSLKANNSVWQQTSEAQLTLQMAGKFDNQGGIFSTKGNLTVKAGGIDNRQGRLIAGKHLALDSAKQKLDSRNGQLIAGGNLTVQSGELINDSGLIQAKQNLVVNTHQQALRNQQTKGTDNNKGIIALGNMVLTNGQFENTQGVVASGGTMGLQTQQMNNTQGVIQSGNALTVTATQVQSDQGKLIAKDNLALTLKGKLSQTSGQIGAKNLQLKADELSSTKQSVITADSVNLAVVGKVDNRESVIHSINDLAIESQALNNKHGEISSQQSSIKIKADSLQNDNGKIVAKSDLHLAIHGKLSQTSGQIGAKNLQLKADELSSTKQSVITADSVNLTVEGKVDNRESVIHATNDLTLTSQAVNNQRGEISSQQNSNVKADSLQNDQGKVVAKSDLNLAINGKLSQTSGQIGAKNLQLKANELASTKQSIITADSVNLAVAGELDNRESVIHSINDLTLISQAVNNQQGEISSQQNSNVKTGSLQNDNGKIVAKNDLNLTVDGKLSQTSGQIGAKNLQLKANELANTQQSVITADSVNLTVAGKVDNRESVIHSTNDLTLTSQALDNQRGEISSQQNSNVKTGSLQNDNGKILAKNDLDLTIHGKLSQTSGQIGAKNLQLTADELASTKQSVITADSVNLTVAGKVDNRESVIHSINDLAIESQALNNQYSEISSQQNISVKADSLQNDNGKIVAKSDLNLAINGKLSQTSGQIGAKTLQLKANELASTKQSVITADSVNFAVAGKVDNRESVIHATNDLTLTSQAVNNQRGEISSQQSAIKIKADSLQNDQGKIVSKSDLNLAVKGKLSQTSGQIGAKNLQLKADELSSTKQSVITADLVNLTVAGKADNSDSVIHSTNDLAITSQTLNNQQGEISSQNNIRVKADSLQNDQGKVVAKSDLNLAINGKLSQASGQIGAKNLQLKADELSSTKQSIITADSVNLTVAGKVDNSDSVIHSTNDLTLTSQAVNNQQGEISSQQNISVKADSLQNDNGKIVAKSDLNLAINGKLSQTSGQIGAKNLQLKADELSSTKQSIITADSVNLAVAGKVNNSESVIHSTNDLTLTSQDLNNQRGEILTYGNSRLVSNALTNDNGKIRVGGELSLKTDRLSQVSGLVNANQLNLVVAQVNSTQGSEISGNEVMLSADTVNNNGSKLVAQQSITLEAKKGVHNQKGVIASLANTLLLNTNKTELDNKQGAILAQNGTLNLQTGQINNEQGLIRAKRAMIDTHQHTLDNHNTLAHNAQGIVADGLTLAVSTLNNQQGRMTAKDSAVITAQSLDNQSGEILAKQNLQLNSTKIENQSGIIASTEGSLNLTTQTALDNQHGQISAADKLMVDTQGLFNQHGKLVSSNQLTLNTHQYKIDNREGKIFAQSSGIIDSGALDNQQGLLRADKQLVLNTHNQPLDNCHTQGKEQGIIGLGQVVLNGISTLLNQQGMLYAGNSLNVTVKNNLNNVEGIIQSHHHALLSATNIDNQAGKISTKAGTINAQRVDNRAISDKGSLIFGENLTLNVQQLDNQGTKAKGSVPEQGIQGTNLILNTETLNNQQGGIYSQQLAKITANVRLDNQQGELLSAHTVDIQHNGNLVVNNQDGLIQGNQLINLNAKNLASQGVIKTAGDLSVLLKDSFILNKAFEVGNNLTFKTEGNFENNAVQSVKNSATFTAKNIINHANAEISANETTINAQSLTNRGLIDGNKTLINSTKVTNIGTGRIYGNHLSFRAENLDNLPETLKDNPQSATIAAREKLDFGVGTLTNRDHALILSLGDLSIGGDIDKEGNAIGQAKFVDNGSATIEVLGDSDINATRLLNHDLYVKLGIDTTKEYIVEHALGKDSTRYREKRDGYYDINNGSKNRHSYFKLNNGTKIEGFGWYSWFYTQTKQTSTLEHTDPAKIAIGGSLKLNGEDLHNKYSKVLVGKQLWLGDSAFSQNESNQSLVGKKVILNNEDIIGEINKTNEGEYRIEKKVRKKRRRHYHYHHNGLTYGPEDLPTEHFSFNQVVNQIGEKLTSNASINNQVLAKDIILDTVEIKPTNKKLNFNTLETNDLKINESAETHIVLTPAIDDKDKNQIIDSGQVIGKLETTITDFDLKSIGTSEVKSVDTSEFKSVGNSEIKSVGNSEVKSVGNSEVKSVGTSEVKSISSSEPKSVGSSEAKSIDNAEFTSFGNLTLPTIKTHLAKVKLPQSSLYRINPDHPKGYLVETDPKFTQREKWLSSDYLLNQLRYDHNRVQKRLGDGFYEQRLVNEQVNQLTGRRFIEGYTSDLEQYKALMNSGAKYAKKFNLAVGVGLTAQQMSELTTDMVWLVNKEITLPTGKKVKVLTPQVYLVARNSDITSRGAVISANKIIGNVDNLKNTGVIAGRELTRIHSNQLENQGTILGDTVNLSAKQNLINLGGKIEAVNGLSLYAGNNLSISSTLSHSKSEDGNFERTVLDKIGSVRVTGQNGALLLKADNNLTVKGALIESKGKVRAEATNLTISTVQTQNKEHYNGDADNYYRLDQKGEVGSQLIGQDGVTLISQKDINLRQATLSSENGNVVGASLNGNITLTSGRAEESLSTAIKSTSRGLLSKRTDISQHDHQTDIAVGNSLQAKNVSLYADNTLTDEGSSIQATDNIYLEGKKGVVLDAAENTHRERNYAESKKSGFGASFSNGIARVGLERNKQQDRYTERYTTYSGTQLQTQNGNMSVVSNEGNIAANATKFESEKDIILQAKNVSLNAKINEKDSVESHRSSTKGIGIGVMYNPISTFKSRYGEQSNQGSAKGIIGKAVTTGEALDKTFQQALNGISPYLTAHKKESERFVHTETANVVEMNTNGNIAIRATAGDIKTQGAMLSAKGNGSLSAKDNIELGVALTEQYQASKRNQKGVDIDLSRRFTDVVGAYYGKDAGDGKLVKEQASVLSFGGKGTLTAANGNVSLVGTQLVADGDMAVSAGQNIVVDTATIHQTQAESSKSHGIGEVVISETERFSGYNRKLSNQDNVQVTHQGAIIGSLNGNVTLDAGKDFHQTSGQILAKNRIDISAENTTFDVAHNTVEQKSHQSDLKVGQFTRVISPLIDLVQSVEQSLNNKEASDRVKAAQLIGLAAQGYNLPTALNHKDNGVLFRVETGVGLSHSRQSEKGEQRDSVGNTLNAQHINVNARSGKLSATQTDFVSRNEKGERLSNSSVMLAGKKGVDLLAGESTYKHEGKNQSYGTEVGTAFSVGAKTGWSFYAQEGFNKGKQSDEGKTYQNSHIDAEMLTIKSDGDVTLKGTVAKAKTIHNEIKGDLHIESLQDEHKQRGRQAGFGTKVEFGFGSAWELSGNANASGGKSNTKQVVEQSGFFAEDGGYHISANNVHLKGGAITSRVPEKSELSTNQLSFSDIQNSSGYRGTSGAISGGYSDTEGKSLTPSLPIHNQGDDESVTRATLTEGRITLNKDTRPMETRAKALGINTDLSQGNRQVEKGKDITHLLEEQQVISQSVGQVVKAATMFSEKQASEAEAKANEHLAELARAKAQGDIAKISEKETAYIEAKAKAESWGEGGDARRKIDAAVAVLGSVLAGQTTVQTVIAGVSPELNAKIHELTKESKTANILAHATLSAAEFYGAGLSPTAGAVAGVVGEGSAMLLSEKVFNKPVEELTTEERNILKTASQLVGAVMGGVAGGSTATVVEGMATSKRAVENNYLSRFSDNRRVWLKDQLSRQDLSSAQREKYEREFIQLEQDDHTSDVLVKKALNTPSDMTKEDWVLHNQYISRYYLESIAMSEKSNDIKSNLDNILSDNYIKGYSYPYATADKYRQYLPSRWSILGTEKLNDEIFYNGIQGKYKNQKVYKESFNGRIAQSTADALGYASMAMPLPSIYANIPKIGAFASKYPTITEAGIIAATNTAFQLSDKEEPYSFSSLAEAELSYFLTRKDSADIAWSKNMMLGAFMEQAEKQEKEMRYGIKEDPEYAKKYLSVSASILGGKGIDMSLRRVNNPYKINIGRPIANSILGESVPKMISTAKDELNNNIKGE